jgi:SAM-dependent methyltransferase
METEKTARLHDLGESIDFYESRYEHGYMEEYPDDVKGKIFAIIRDLGLPHEGRALDFGCGNGVLTDIIRQALPTWSVCGTDLSRKALANARTRFPECTFIERDDPSLKSNAFDFLFSNHVIEHVADLDDVLDQMSGAVGQKGSMLHFLPCGNAGSYEHDLCMLRKDGINPQLGNRFFFEDEGHLRRLTTDQLRGPIEARSFTLVRGYYSNQYWGAVEWLTGPLSNVGFLRDLTDPSRAVDRSASLRLMRMRIFLTAIAMLRLHAEISSRLLSNRLKRRPHVVAAMLLLPFYIVSKPVDALVKRAAKKEWETRKFDRNGSEMALHFKRG